MDQRSAATLVAMLASAAASAAPPKVLDVEEIVVTGTTIPTTPDAVAVPVVTLTAADLEKGGSTASVLDMLRKAIPGFEGRSNTGNSNASNNNQNTAGGSQLQLRNLPTLVLINGRRAAIDGIAGINGKNFVDVSQIPPAAIERIEVLTDGASSIYGADAVGGVVNFILKSNYEGLTFGGRDGSADRYNERSAYASGGTRLGDVSIVATASYTHTDPLFQNERAFDSPYLGHVNAISLPGVVAGGADQLNPALSSPSQKNQTGAKATASSLAALVANGTYLPTSAANISNAFDLSPYQTLLLKQDIASFAASLQAPLIADGRLDLFGDVLVSRGKSWTRWQPVAASNLVVPAGAPFNPLTTAFPPPAPAGVPNPGVDFADLAIRHEFFNTEYTTRLTTGLRGDITAGWNWESAVVYSEDDLRQEQTGVIFKPNLALAIAGGYDASGAVLAGGAYSKVLSGYSLTGPLVLQPALDPFATGNLNPASLANLYGTEHINTVSRLISWDGKVVGRVLPLPGGDLDAAVGVSVRRESLSGHTDANGRNTDPATGATNGNDQLWVGGTYSDPFAKTRTISAAFTEVRVPITGSEWNVPVFRAFDLTAAVRTEHFSDAGNSTVPKFGFRWQPFDDQFTLRGNYAKSFVAPPLFAEYGPTATRTSTGPVATAFGPTYAGLTFNAEDGSNPTLKAATAISRTVGFVFKPELIQHLTLTADYSDISLNGFQGGAGFNNILLSINSLGSASPVFNSLAIGNFPGQPGATNPFSAPGSLQTFLTIPGTNKGDPNQAAKLYMIDYFRNFAQLLENSWNISGTYSLPTHSAGTFSVATNGTIFTLFKFNPGIAGQPTIEGAGYANNAGVFGGTLPKYRFYSTLDWTYGNVDVTVGNTYVSELSDTGGSGTLAPMHVSSYATFDMRVAYDWHGSSKLQDVQLAVGVNNLANRQPSLDPRTFNTLAGSNADISTYSPIGRLVYGTISVGF
jgi:iron complex outermembrane receptor protein